MNFKKSTKKLNVLLLLTTCLLLSGFIVFSSQQVKLTKTEITLQKPEKSIKTSKVIKVFDGDTIQLETGEKVRYIGIDSPEVYPKQECYSLEAKKENEKLVLGKNVILEKDISDVDKYGRQLRYVYVLDDFKNKVFINETLIKNGFAKATNYLPDEKYKTTFKNYENMSKKNNIGIWRNCKNQF